MFTPFLRYPLIGYLLPLVLAGCQPAQLSEPADENEDAIVNGALDNGDPAVVAILSFSGLPDENGRFSGSLCTGEVIAPRLVLTAAHCNDANAFFVEVHTRPDVRGVQPGQGNLVVRRTPHPQYDPKTNNYDVAVYEVANPINVKPLEINRSGTGLQGMDVRVIGYGAARFDENGIVGVGLKRQAATKIEKVEALKITLPRVVYGGQVGTQCAGDSGGPALANFNGVERIVGVSSYTAAANLAERCTAPSVDTRIDAVLAFIDGILKGAGAPSAPTPPAGNPPPAGQCNYGSVQVSAQATGAACTPTQKGGPGAPCAGPQDCSSICSTCSGQTSEIAACVDNRCVDAQTTRACAAELAACM